MLDVLSSLFDYCEKHSKGLNPVLEDLERTTHLKTTQPRMLSGSVQGLFLQMISILKKPKNILEIGTFTGYSAICLAKGLVKGGKLTTIDVNPETLVIAKEYIKRCDMEKRIEILHGKALEIIPGLQGDFDIVFIDADKENYIRYYDMVRPRMAQGGLIIADNMLWSGKVLNEVMDHKTKVLDDLNKRIMADRGVENVLLPIRDGIHLVRIL